MARLKVGLKERSYDIVIGSGNLSQAANEMKKLGLNGKAFVITDTKVNKLYGKTVLASLKKTGYSTELLVVPQGEGSKCQKQVSALYDKLIAKGAHRDSFVVALGGGVVGDLAGFVAATYMRGVPYIQVPTTLLAQVDSSVGGKTGIDHPKGKNLIGAFYQPKLVYIDVQTLSTLAKREFNNGLAEVIKYGVIKDQSLFKYLELNIKNINNNKVLEHIVLESCKNKAIIVEKDEREQNLRMILNYGHSFGHAIETLNKYKNIKHGEAVAIGMVLAAKLAVKMGLLNYLAVEKIEKLIKDYKLPVELKGLKASDIIKVLKVDKKVKDGKLQFILPKKIGNVIITKNVKEKDLLSILKEK